MKLTNELANELTNELTNEQKRARINGSKKGAYVNKNYGTRPKDHSFFAGSGDGQPSVAGRWKLHLR